MLFSFEGKTPTVGKDSYVSETAQVIGDVVIGDSCYIGHGAILRGDYGRIVIGDGTAVEEGVIIHAPPDHTQTIGSHVTLGHGVIAHGHEIGDYTVVGMGAVLSLFSKTGEWTIVAEGSVVKANQEISGGKVAAGNPAKVVRDVRPEDKELWNYGKKVYVDLALRYLKSGLVRVD
jgi:carbonic anhydrase/acetyltransferase-like protein (isoleucine patch superfamily)